MIQRRQFMKGSAAALVYGAGHKGISQTLESASLTPIEEQSSVDPSKKALPGKNRAQVSKALPGASDPSPQTVSMTSFVAPEKRIAPMPLKERIRLGAVPKRGMCSTIPASDAPDALISGNGKMYVEVFGNPFAERIIFHHERLLTPWKGDPIEAPNIASALPEVRRLILEGQYRKANELALAKASEGPSKPETGNLREHAAFSLRIDSAGEHAVWDYLRTIDFESGEVTVRWNDSAGAWRRSIFVSRPDNVVVQLLTAPEGAEIHASIELDTSEVLGGHRRAGNRVVVAGRAGMPEQLKDPGATEIRFEQNLDSQHVLLQGHYVVDHGNPGYAGVTRVICDGGSIQVDGKSLRVSGAHSLTLITRIEVQDDLNPEDVNALKAAVDAAPTSYGVALDHHRAVQTEVMDRVSINFGGDALHAMSGEEMLADQRMGEGYNGALLSNIFDMGRYWLYLRCGEFPPIWGHVNINVNLQISEAVMGDLPECMDSYTHWTEGLLSDSRVNARNIFGAKGALFPIHPTQRGGQLDHFAFGWPHEYWISAGGWMYSPMWDYFLATGDREYLSEHLLPGLQEIAMFYEDYLTEVDNNGKYIFVPSYSPENWPANTDSSPTVINADMDIMVCREVFTHLIAASQMLNVNRGKISQWKAILAKLPPYLIDSDGSLKEWSWPTLEEGNSLDHRHLSHMYGVWPGDEITPDQTPDLARAAWLAARKRAQGNASAHGLLHRALTACRLNDAYLLNFDLKQILEQGYVNPSLTTRHNPYSYPAPDPQGGLPTIMMEMLVYSRPGVIGLLPALPDALNDGTAKGIVCRTQAKVDELSWNLKTSKLRVTINSGIDQVIDLVVRRGIENIDAPEGVLVHRPARGAQEVQVKLLKSHPVTLHVDLGKEGSSGWLEEAVQ